MNQANQIQEISQHYRILFEAKNQIKIKKVQDCVLSTVPFEAV